MKPDRNSANDRRYRIGSPKKRQYMQPTAHSDKVAIYVQILVCHHGDKVGGRGGNVDPSVIGLALVTDQRVHR
jgi:hypothetical protein